MPKRKYRPVAEYYITEFLALNYPPGTWRTNVPLGDVETELLTELTPAEKRFIGKPFRPICDAVVLLEDEVHLVEAKIRDERGKIEQLLIYEYLFPKTPEFKAHWHKHIRKILVTPKHQGNFEKFLQKYGIEVVYFRPPWIEEYLGTLDRRYRRGHYFSVKFD